MKVHRGDLPVVVIGGGLGGLVTALELAPLPVLLVTRTPPGREAASAWAQGGLAAALGDDDTPALHAVDTCEAGDGLCDTAVVDLVTREAAQAVHRLEHYGVRFDRDPAGCFALGREGGHRRRRIVHARDATGDALTRALADAVRRTASITVMEDTSAESLLLDDGAVTGVLATRGAERLLLAARAVVLATGGAGALYARTSNPLGARGDGLVMAARAGALLADLEFMQFHPTALDLGRDPMPLATEALRGDGAVLVNDAGERFMTGLHPLADLAPRDIVARAIFRQRAAGRRVFLDARESPGARFAARFPTVHASCMAARIDPSRQLMPVAPAAHYHMGGVAVDTSGRSSLAGLWAVGEVAATGLHGANRLASNSLLEAAVFGVLAARDIGATAGNDLRPSVPPRTAPPAGPPDWAGLARLRALMDRCVGVERDERGLGEAIGALLALRDGAGPGLLGNAATAGLMLAVSAERRHESRGGHFRSDYPLPADVAARSFTTLAEVERTAAGLSATAGAVAIAATG